MALDITLAQFNEAASGKYNAGELDVERKNDGTVELVKVNAHVHFTLLNRTEIDPANTLEIKEAFVKALSPRLDPQAMAAVRKQLGLPPEVGGTVREDGHAYEPLTRGQVRSLIDQYAPEMSGAQRSGTASRTEKRTKVNEETEASRPVTVGGQELMVGEIGTDKIAFQGVTKAKRAASAQEGIDATANDILGVLKRPDGGRADLNTLVRKLNTLEYFCARAASLDPAGGPAGRRFEAALARVLDALDNGELALVYKGMMSREVDGLKGEVSRRLASTSTLPSLHSTCQSLLATLSRLEARVASEVAYRIGDDPTAPVTRYGAAAATQHGAAGEMTVANLRIIKSRTDDELRSADGKLDIVDARLKSHGFTKAESHRIGDMLRANELTINIHLENLLGWRDGRPPALADPNFQLRNTFTSKEVQHLPTDGTGYLVKRDEVERYFFPEYAAIPLQGKDRPLYAALNTRRVESGAAGTGMYGSTVIVLKQHVKQQATYTLNDTFFSLRLDVDAASRGRFEQALRAAMAGRASQGEMDALMGPGGAVCGMLDGFFARNDGQKVEATAPAGMCSDIAKSLSAVHHGDMRPLDANDVHAIMIRTMASAEAPSDLTATYDNIETLLTKTSDFQAVGFGVHTLRRMQDPKSPVKMAGCDYVEAQLHGPIVLGRDVEEIRVLVDDIRLHFRSEYDGLAQKPAGVTKREWVDQQVARQKQEIMRMSAQSGVKVSFYGDKDDANFDLSQVNQFEDIKAARDFMRPEIMQAADHALGAGFGDVLADARLRLTPAQRALMDSTFGTDLSRAPDWFVDKARQAGRRVYGDINDPNDREIVDAETAVDSVRNFVADTVNVFATALVAMEKLGVTDLAERKELLHMLAMENISAGNAHSFVAAKLAMKALHSSLNGLISTTMAADIPKEARDLLAEIGVEGNQPLGGQGLSNLEDRVGKFILGQVKRGGTPTVASILEAARKNVVLPAVRLRVGLMASTGEWAFPSPEERKAFTSWLVNSGKLKYLEEVKGAYEASTLLVDRLEEALRRDELDTTKIVEIFRDMATVVVRYAGMTAAYVDGDFGPDDRRAAMFRPINTALSRLALRVDHNAMAKLAAAMSAPDVGRLAAAATATVDAARNVRGAVNTVPFSQFTRFLDLTCSRLASKFNVTCELSVGRIPKFSEIPAEHRALLTSIDPNEFAKIASANGG